MTDKVKCDDVYLEFAGRLSALNANLVHDATSHFDVFVTCHAVARTLLEERTHLWEEKGNTCEHHAWRNRGEEQTLTRRGTFESGTTVNYTRSITVFSSIQFNVEQTMPVARHWVTKHNLRRNEREDTSQTNTNSSATVTTCIIFQTFAFYCNNVDNKWRHE